MVVRLAVYHVVSLIGSAGDQRLPGQGQIGKIGISGIFLWIIDAHRPGIAITPRTHGADVAAHVEHVSRDPLLLQRSGHHLHGISFRYGSHVQLHHRIGQRHGGCDIVDEDILNIRMIRRLLQILHRRKLGVPRLVRSFRPVIVPEGENAAHGDIHFAVGFFVHLLGIEEQIYDPLIHRHGAMGTACQLVDGTEILHPFKPMVDGIQFVILPQLGKDLAGNPVELVLAIRIPHDGGNGIEIIKGVGGIFGICLFTGGECGNIHQHAQHQGNKTSFHTIPMSKMGGCPPIFIVWLS